MKLPFLTLVSAAALLSPVLRDAHARSSHGEARAPAPLNTQLFYGALVVSESAKRNLLGPLSPEKPLLPSLVPEGLLPPDFKYRASPLRPVRPIKSETPEPSGRDQPVPIPVQGSPRR